MATVSIVGAGMMGSALSVPLADGGHDVRLVGTHLDEDIVDSLRSTGKHPKLGQHLPREVVSYRHTEIARAMAKVDAIALGVSSAGVGWAARAIAPFVSRDVPIVMVTKGLDCSDDGLILLPDQLARELGEPAPAPAAIAGPCIAGELAKKTPTCVVLAGRDETHVARLADLLRAPYYHVRESSDVTGVEICAALKNAYAMGIALAAGLHERQGGAPGSVAMHNYESAVFAQAIVEMTRLVADLGGDPTTVAGLAGVGDLDVTCNGGRTGRFGRWLGLGLGRNEAIEKMEGATLECLEILEVMHRALPLLEAEKIAEQRSFPLLRHLIRVALFSEPIDMPFSEFFEESV